MITCPDSSSNKELIVTALKNTEASTVRWFVQANWTHFGTCTCTNPKHGMRCNLAPRLTNPSAPNTLLEGVYVPKTHSKTTCKRVWSIRERSTLFQGLPCCALFGWPSFWVASPFRSSLSTVLWDSSSSRRQAAKIIFLQNQATLLNRKIGYFSPLWLFGMGNLCIFDLYSSMFLELFRHKA